MCVLNECVCEDVCLNVCSNKDTVRVNAIVQSNCVCVCVCERNEYKIVIEKAFRNPVEFFTPVDPNFPPGASFHFIRS